ncbi:MAG: hypothetical protein ACP5OV_03690 [Acidimicrobiales bacterium]
MDERRILSTTRQSSVEVTRVNFSTVRRGGLDPHEVRTHLEAVGREMSHLEHKIRELQDQLADALRRAANPVFDEATLASALGTQSAAILRSAHEEAGRVTAEAQERAAQLSAESQQRGAAHLIEAQERSSAVVAEAETTAAQINHEARLAAERLVDTAKTNASVIIDRAREQGRAIVDQATQARRTVLNDLLVKRKALSLQIEQLRVARDALAGHVSSVREETERLLDSLHTSDESARAAAIEALRLRPSSPDPTEEELLAGTPLREVPEGSADAEGAAEVSEPAAGAAPAPLAEPSSRPVPPPVPAPEDASGTDVVNEIFARLRQATRAERGAPAPRRAAAPKTSGAVIDELFHRRDAALDESLAVLTRKVKRALQDDQNVMLERLRSAPGAGPAELEDERAQRTRYADAAYDALADAAAAGAQFAFDERGATGAAVDPRELDEVAADFAVTIALALRKRIVADGSGDATERVNAAYREWRGPRVERLCTDAARRAFHQGVAAAAHGGALHFVASPGEPPCDVCARDAAAGPRPAGQRFPSGAPYPPLHAGCACTVLPVAGP